MFFKNQKQEKLSGSDHAIHIGFHRLTELGQIFHYKQFYKENSFQVARLHLRRMELANILSERLRNPWKET